MIPQKERMPCFHYARGLLPSAGVNCAHILTFAQLLSSRNKFYFHQRIHPMNGTVTGSKRINEHWSSWQVCVWLPSPNTPCHPNDSLPDINGHFWKFLGNESTETVLQHLHSTSAIRDIYSQDLQQQWTPLILATAAIGLTQLDSFPREISVHLLALILFQKAFS